MLLLDSALLRRDPWHQELAPAQVMQTPHLLINLDRRTVQTRSAPSSRATAYNPQRRTTILVNLLHTNL